MDPLSAMVLRSQDNSLELAKLPSIRPADSLAFVPKDLTATENMLFIAVDKPSVITLRTVSDKRGDRFHVAPHREAVIIECPLGGNFMVGTEGAMVKKGDKKQAAEMRCMGDEEVIKFQVRGVGSLRAGWKKKSKDGQEFGIIEGIEDDLDIPEGEEGALVRRDKVAKTHTVPLRVKHDTPGTYTISLTSVADSHHNTHTPSGHSAEKVFNVVARPTAQFEHRSIVQMLKDKTVTLGVVVEAEGGLPADVEVTYEYKLAESGEVGTKKLKIGRKVEGLVVSEPGTYRLLDVAGQCAGSILEPACVTVILIPPPSVEMSVTTLHEWLVFRPIC